MVADFDKLPRRIFLDSCTAQTMRRYGEYIYDGGVIADDDPIWTVTLGIENVEALRKIFFVSQRANFEWTISRASLDEGLAKRDPGHMNWLWEIAAYTAEFLDPGGRPASSHLASRLDGTEFGYLSQKDRLLVKQATELGCQAFLTVERRLPTNAAHVEREIGLRILTPVTLWEMLRPWAALW